jgi:outer membrane protein assembly factor BamE (lipoprotein component of BamABCDE complex)
MSSVMKIISLLAIAFFCIILFFTGAFPLSEGYNPVKPGIDTKFSANYNEDNFNKITVGMDTAEVVKLVGEPIGKLGRSTRMWYYTSDGNCKWMNFAWLARDIVVSANGKVRDIHKSVRYD